MNMNDKNMQNRQEQMIKEVLPIGNGAHIYAPREWIGEEVLVVRTIKPSLKERILQELGPYLENIIGIYLYGSYARSEARENSDIDLLVITDKKIKISKKGFDIIALEKNSFGKALKLSPILLFSALAEAKTIVNPELLKRMKEEHKPKAEYFKDYIKETKNIIKINRELLEPYSLILRLRGVYIINCLLDRSSYSHEKFKLWLKKNLPFVDINSVYGAYAKVKKNLKSGNLNQKDLELVLAFLEKQVLELEVKLNGKKRKEA